MAGICGNKVVPLFPLVTTLVQINPKLMKHGHRKSQDSWCICIHLEPIFNN